jgi:hypothetical protein
MMKIITLTIYLLISGIIANAQQNYNVSLIPKELLPYASAVVRDEEMKVEVEDLNSTIVHEKMAVTIFNKNGDHMAHIEVEHDKSTIIKNIKGLIYNDFGKQIGKFSEGDFDDASGWDGFSLFNDARVKHYFPSVTEYPYTIVYEYELRLKQSLNLPGWEPNSGTGVAVEKSSFTFICKPDFTIRYKENKIPEKAIVSTDNRGLKTYTWQVNNLKALKDEPFSPYPEKYLSSVKIAPEKFEYEGIRGEYTDWEGLGKWEYDKLVADRQALPPETIEHIKDITKDIPDLKLKAKKIYEYMQGKTHYISVQVGIGGYQPFLASDVDKQNYGDCKALVNYTQALLKAVNIDSYYCVVEANDNYKVSFMDDFASMQQGDHIILCMPFKNDTTWADCTSETIPFGYLGDFTDDRTVLACTPEGGKLMHTPKYTVQDNLRSRKASFVINNDGQLSGNMGTTFKGVDYDDRYYLVGEPKTEQVKMLQRQYPINNMDIESFDLKQDKSFNPVTTENIKLSARDYASMADGKYYFTLNPIDRLAIPHQVRNRVNSVYINRGHTDEDEITYTIPAGYHLEKDPLDLSIDKPFAKFTATMKLKGNQLIYKRKFQLIDGTYSKDTYQDLVDFYQAVVDADEYNVVLVKNN